MAIRVFHFCCLIAFAFSPINHFRTFTPAFSWNHESWYAGWFHFFSFINHSQIMIHAFRLRPRELVCWLVSVFVHFYFPYILFRLMQRCYGSLPLIASAWVETSYVMTYCPRVRPPDSVIVRKCNVSGPPRQSWPIFEILVFSF